MEEPEAEEGSPSRADDDDLLVVVEEEVLVVVVVAVVVIVGSVELRVEVGAAGSGSEDWRGERVRLAAVRSGLTCSTGGL